VTAPNVLNQFRPICACREDTAKNQFVHVLYRIALLIRTQLLRHAGRLLGLTGSTALAKRAIQFGSRIAKSENTKQKGSDAFE
jgi:hypothetical protein